jgi:hypothetical protein
MFRVVRAMCKLLRCILPSDDQARETISPIFQSLFQCLLLPSESHYLRVLGKISINEGHCLGYTDVGEVMKVLWG